MRRSLLLLVPAALVMLGRAHAADPPAPADATAAAPAAVPATAATPAPATNADPGDKAPPAPAATSKPSSGRFEPTEKIRADFDVSFPVDI